MAGIIVQVSWSSADWMLNTSNDTQMFIMNHMNIDDDMKYTCGIIEENVNNKLALVNGFDCCTSNDTWS